jgi:LacI family transcriptional regulator
MASRRTKILGLVAPDFSEFSAARIAAGAQATAQQQGYFFILTSNRLSDDKEPAYLQLYRGGYIEGLLYFALTLEAENPALIQLCEQGLPIIAAAQRLPHLNVPIVDHDNVKGGRLATQHLLDYGHRRIAMITGPARDKAAQDRIEGYTQALNAAGLSFDSNLVVAGDWYHESGAEAARILLDRGKPFSAIFAQSDRMAMGAIYALRQAGLHTPQEISIVGFDDIPEAVYFDPPLTTVRQSSYEMGVLATRMLINAVEGSTANQGDVLLEVELVPRVSVAPKNRV